MRWISKQKSFYLVFDSSIFASKEKHDQIPDPDGQPVKAGQFDHHHDLSLNMVFNLSLSLSQSENWPMRNQENENQASHRSHKNQKTSPFERFSTVTLCKYHSGDFPRQSCQIRTPVNVPIFWSVPSRKDLTVFLAKPAFKVGHQATKRIVISVVSEMDQRVDTSMEPGPYQKENHFGNHFLISIYVAQWYHYFQSIEW